MVVVCSLPLRVLIVDVAEFGAVRAVQTWNVQGIVIHQPDRAFDRYQNVAVLQIAVRQTTALQTVHQAAPLRRELQQVLGPRQMLFHIRVQRDAVHPLHFNERICLSQQANALRLIREIHQERQPEFFEVSADMLVVPLLIYGLPQKTAHGPPLPAVLDLVHTGKVARRHARQAHRQQGHLARFQFRVFKAEARVLNRVLIVGRIRPFHTRRISTVVHTCLNKRRLTLTA